MTAVKKSTKTHIKNVVTTVISLLLLVLAAYIIVGSVVAKSNNEQFRFFGISLHVVVTDSMEPEIKVGDYLIAKSADIKDVKVGDDVIFVSKDPFLRGERIVHRVVTVKNTDGVISLVTKGIKEGATEDKYEVTEIVGIKIVNSAFLGKVYQLFTSPFGIVTLLIVLVCVIVVIKQIKKIARATKKE